MNTISVKFKGIKKQGLDPKKSKVCLPISVGQQYHEGEKLETALLAAKNQFASVDIVVADTLQRYNYLDQLCENTATDLTLKLGNAWIERNQSYLSKHSFKIIRWDECIGWNTFSEKLLKIKNYYQQSIFYQEKCKETVDKFILRKKIDVTQQLIQDSLNYLLEEIAVLFSYFIDNKYQYIAYPGSIPLIDETSTWLFRDDLFKEYLNPIKIEFKY